MSISFVAIDFETANSKRASACSVGLVKVINGQIVDTFYSLIDPEDDFDDFNIIIHGILPDDVINSPTYPSIIKSIERFSEDLPLVAHYAPFDMGVIRDSNDRYDIDDFTAKYIDSYYLSRFLISTISYKLRDIATLIGEQFQHHNALEDARMAAMLILYLCKQHNLSYLNELMDVAQYKKFGVVEGKEGSGFRRAKARRNKQSKLSNADIKQLVSSIDKETLDASHPFFEKNACFTGKLESLTRLEGMTLFAQVGGFPEKGVTQKTNYLIMGEQDMRIVGSEGKSSKIKKAESLLARGQDIQLLGEMDFLKMID
ncbi:exonuclease domain-containing protein [Candidatus Enterococcus clewellii]|uniref:DNA polymerase III subunit epsilon n=1 Tax=Candidatus Enterococcus clewellii TaxID=1834193 RepID=A0A242KDL1_9ENTE|nr:exonuclease domain-containing protein [Enterococcus sp. 9E7_DIV0242]OTP19159.1 hypothetical protein A5888_000973 [Enterococcus sp. 9E7_DIV0242]